MQHEIPEIELDITYTIKAIIFFESKMPLSLISTIHIHTSMDITNFYIIDIPILFSLCFKDINILGIYLNNIINLFICLNGKNFFINCK